MKTTNFENGLTIAELKNLIKDCAEKDINGDPFEVYIMTGEGSSSIVKSVCVLNKTELGNDILFDRDIF